MINYINNKTRLVKEFLKDLGVTVRVDKIPNVEIIAAMGELNAGKGEKFKKC